MQVETPDLGDEQLRAKYSDKDRKALAAKGQAMPDGSYPIADAEDLQNAIHAVGRGGSSHDAIRKHIIARAKALGKSDSIPDNWNSDGTMKQANSARRPKARHRAVPLVREHRTRNSGLTFRDLDVEGGKGSTVEIRGIPIVYNAAYSVRDMFGQFEEQMLPGVAAGVLPDADVRFLIDHDPSRVLARTVSGTMQIDDSSSGLQMVATIDTRDSDAKNLAVRVERGDISQMSCGFIVADDEWNDEMDQRTIHRLAELLDVSAVTYPASPTTTIQVAHRAARQVSGDMRNLLQRAALELEAGEITGADRSSVVLRILSAVVTDSESLDLTHAVRLRRVYADLRAGKSISASNQALIVSAVKTLHGVLDASGLDPGDLIGQENHPADDAQELPEEPAAEFENSTGNVDGSVDGLYGEPLNDPGDQIRATPSESLLAAVSQRHGRRRSQSFQQSSELLKQAKLRIIRK